MIYFYSYVWTNDQGRMVFESALSRRHPLLIVKDWHEKYQGNNNSLLISYHAIGDEQVGDLELQRYIDYTLGENDGELHAGPGETV